MRAFVIADASRRKAKPVGMLFWKPDPSNEQGRFTLEMASGYADDLPLSLSFFAKANHLRATPEQSEEWVKSRIVPEDRHNISAVLMANGLSRYDEVSLLAASQGRSSDDDFLVYEIDLPERPASATVDDLLSSVVRRREGSEVRYAFVELPSDASACVEETCASPKAENHDGDARNAAQRIGALVRSRRREAGLTQKQLAARAGITQTVLSRVESGSGNPTLALLEELAGALGCTLDIGLEQVDR